MCDTFDILILVAEFLPSQMESAAESGYVPVAFGVSPEQTVGVFMYSITVQRGYRSGDAGAARRE